MTLDDWLENERGGNVAHGFECVGREALARLWDAAKAAGEWRPIETAPKNGTWHLRWSKGSGFAIANEPPGRFAGEWSMIHDRWAGTALCAARSATHWMPLPEPPNDR